MNARKTSSDYFLFAPWLERPNKNMTFFFYHCDSNLLNRKNCKKSCLKHFGVIRASIVSYVASLCSPFKFYIIMKNNKTEVITLFLKGFSIL